MRTEKELAYITQDLLDWMSNEWEEKKSHSYSRRNVPLVVKGL